MSHLVEVDNLSIALPAGSDRALAVENVTFHIDRGEVLSLVGESGSGKSVLAAAIAGLLPRKSLTVTEGATRFDGVDTTNLPEHSFRLLRGKRIGFVFQEPMTALNPVLRVGDQIDEALSAHHYGSRAERQARVLELVRATRLPDPETIVDRFPHQLSGGQRQRVMIAIAIANEPDLLIADEPTTALDVTTQAEILKLILEIRDRLGLAVLFITHDFGVVADIADRVIVLKQGRIVEEGPARRVLDHPVHDYTTQLVASIPSLVPARPRRRTSEPLLCVESLSKAYRGRGQMFRPAAKPVNAVDAVDLVVHRGETVALVGESGSGKTTLGHCIVGLSTWDKGTIRLEGKDFGRIGYDPKLRRRVQMVFQDPFASLNPRHKVRRIITEAAIVNGATRRQAEDDMFDLLRRVGLEPSAAERYPYAFSGGQRQRIGLARALILKPDLLVADEPVSALDVSIQAQILSLLGDIRRDLGLAMLFITHDLRVAAQVADRIVVMQKGRIVEDAASSDVLGNPASDYARSLLAAIPGLDWERERTARHSGDVSAAAE